MTDFNQEAPKVPTEVGRVKIILEDYGAHPLLDPVTGLPLSRYQGTFEIQLLDQSGEVLKVRNGDLAPYLTATQKTAIKNLQDAFRVKAEKLIPPPTP
jgi:hypothetical protein